MLMKILSIHAPITRQNGAYDGSKFRRGFLAAISNGPDVLMTEISEETYWSKDVFSVPAGRMRSCTTQLRTEVSIINVVFIGSVYGVNRL